MMKLLAALLIVIAAAPVAASAEEPLTSDQVRVSVYTRPGDRFYPEEAQRKGISGQASILCTVGARGKLSDCEVTSENPAGAGFGYSIRRMAQTMTIAPVAKDGSPTAGRKFCFTTKFGLPASDGPGR